MAEHLSVNKTNAKNKVLTSFPLPAKMSLFMDEITLDAAAIDDIAVMVDLPIGFIPVGGQVIADALGASSQISVGKRVGGVDTVAAYSAAASSNTAEKVFPLAFGADGRGPLTKTHTVILQVKGAAATGKVTVQVWGFATMS